MCIDYCAADNREVNEPLIRSGLAGLLDSGANGFILIACDEHDLPIRYAAVSTGWSLEVGGADYILDEILFSNGEGLGRQLINAAEDRCAELGVRHLSRN